MKTKKKKVGKQRTDIKHTHGTNEEDNFIQGDHSKIFI